VWGGGGQWLPNCLACLVVENKHFVEEKEKHSGASSTVVMHSVAEPNHFYADPPPDLAQGKNFDAAPDLAAPAPTLLYSKAKFSQRTKV
jgi:hypothetical protein